MTLCAEGLVNMVKIVYVNILRVGLLENSTRTWVDILSKEPATRRKWIDRIQQLSSVACIKIYLIIPTIKGPPTSSVDNAQKISLIQSRRGRWSHQEWRVTAKHFWQHTATFSKTRKTNSNFRYNFCERYATNIKNLVKA